MPVALLTEAERAQQLVEWNQTTREYESEQCIQQLFEAQVERTPEAVAVVYEAEQLTYAELNERANQLAHYLRALGVGPEVLVGICVERSLEMVVGVLGILKAGGAYVPLDADYPLERLSFMLEDAGVGVLLTQARLEEKLPAQAGQVVCLDREWRADRGTVNGEPGVSDDGGESLLCDLHQRLDGAAQGSGDRTAGLGQLRELECGDLSVRSKRANAGTQFVEL